VPIKRLPIAVVVIACCCGAGSAVGEANAKDCGATATASPVTTETASAGYLSNFTNRAGSIRATSKSMLTSAIETVRSETVAPRIIFKSTPELSTKSDSDDEMCKRLEKSTTKEPLQFDGKQFASVDDLTDWIMAFTQGEGEDGKSLYEQCPGTCSPQYTWWIDSQKTELEVQARVVCGMPRNRDSDQYRLSVELVAVCPDKKPE
jgi:hypothetical protein